MIRIVYEIDCHCGKTAQRSSLDLSMPQSDGSILIDVEMAACQSDFECDHCGCITSTGDLDFINEPPHCAVEE